MNHRAAIIDLGTNTFHLLIVEWEGRHFQTLTKLQIPVKLGKGAFENGWITEEAFSRGISAIHEFRQLTEEYNVDHIEMYGTATLRMADNAEVFQAQIEEILGSPLRIISGHEEAELIYNGVNHAVPMGNDPHLIMDIGGGSVEFIIADSEHIYWKHSYNIGVARLLEKYTANNPIDDLSKLALETYLEVELQQVWRRAAKYQVKTLIGSSGSFETLSNIDMHLYHSQPQSFPFVHYILDIDHFHEIHDKIVNSTREELSEIPGMVAFRVEMISIGVMLINYVLNRLQLKKIIVSDYALKEGIMFRIMEGSENKVTK